MSASPDGNMRRPPPAIARKEAELLQGRDCAKVNCVRSSCLKSGNIFLIRNGKYQNWRGNFPIFGKLHASLSFGKVV